MAKQAARQTYIFVNPNTPKAFERQLQKILMEKLLSRYRQNK